jgi:hypothetical protein
MLADRPSAFPVDQKLLLMKLGLSFDQAALSLR